VTLRCSTVTFVISSIILPYLPFRTLLRHVLILTVKNLFQLGGKNPGIIFADADLDKCIPTTIRLVKHSCT